MPGFLGRSPTPWVRCAGHGRGADRPPASRRCGQGLPQQRVEDAAARVGKLRSWTVQARSETPQPRDDIGIEAARRSVTSGSDQPLACLAPGSGGTGGRDPRRDRHGGRQCELEPGPPLERLGIKASVLTVLTVTPDGPDPRAVVRDADPLPLVLAVRDAYRHTWRREWVRGVLNARPDAVLAWLRTARSPGSRGCWPTARAGEHPGGRRGADGSQQRQEPRDDGVEHRGAQPDHADDDEHRQHPGAPRRAAGVRFTHAPQQHQAIVAGKGNLSRVRTS